MPDFVLEDVWALPAHGGREDFQTLLDLMGLPKPEVMTGRSLLCPPGSTDA